MRLSKAPFINKFFFASLLVALGVGLHSSISIAAFTPISLGIIPPAQLPPSDFSVTGLRVSALWGHHRGMYGIDAGVLGNITDQEFAGSAFSGIFNLTHGATTILGIQLAGITNVNTGKTNSIGVQLAGIWNQNTSESSVTGLQIALIGNQAAFTNIYGAQVGLYNRAKSVYGLQVGLLNIAEDLHGIQIGLLNFNNKGLFTIAPFVNVGF